MKKIKRILLTLTGIFILVQIISRIIKGYLKFPCPAFMGSLLDSSYRKKIQPASQIISRSGIKEDMKVLELGCGSGAFTVDVARAVGRKGKVYALDIQMKMLSQLRNKLSKPENKDINNIEIIHNNAYNLPFENDFFDLVYMVTVLPEIPDKKRALNEIRRVLKPNGIFAVTELIFDPDYPLKSTTIKWCEDSGFILDKSSGNILNYTVRFIKP